MLFTSSIVISPNSSRNGRFDKISAFNDECRNNGTETPSTEIPCSFCLECVSWTAGWERKLDQATSTLLLQGRPLNLCLCPSSETIRKDSVGKAYSYKHFSKTRLFQSIHRTVFVAIWHDKPKCRINIWSNFLSPSLNESIYDISSYFMS